MEDLKRSISEDPKLMTVRPLLVSLCMVVFAGNQRLRACIALGWEAIPCIVCDWTQEEQDRAMIKDNGHHGEFDMDILTNRPPRAISSKSGVYPSTGTSPNPKTNPKNQSNASTARR